MAKIEIDDSLLEVLARRSAEKNFDDVGDYIRWVLGQIADEISQRDDDTRLTEDDEEDIKERLKSLGYLE